ncbi:MAG: hypothetical protein HUJ22_09865 [Gracilimonas sp.]|uniref:N,N-dimethylformamidase beta subunit family domain-containing protein n=1 Tax=Gracilimonas sp. TaxID=1974203 RepID=UPI0019ACBA74|nr:N,N-dimethylformamidase beta subunit family domain-containing protein [Gracilimonas sp.]MBD3616867.1 hypothetical protein [Gracilimonas sp.]
MDTQPMIKQGSIKNGELAAPIEGAVLQILDKHDEVLAHTQTSESGKWKMEIPESASRILVSKKGFSSKEYCPAELPELIRLLENDLLGYQPKLWFKPGEEIEVFVHSLSPWKSTLYRHGVKKERILELGECGAQIQELPDHWFVENGLSWETSLTYEVPKDAKPGLYSLLLETEKQQFAIPFTVSSPSPNNRLLVLASTNNWQSYNIWGGRNRYRSFENTHSKDFSTNIPLVNHLAGKIGKRLPSSWVKNIRGFLGLPAKEKPWMFQKLSVKRPFTNCALEDEKPEIPFTNHLAGGEWRILAWLEREGFEYDMISGFELHQHPELLKNYDAILLSTHCEYWSKSMYYGLKEANQQHKLSILNISGNSIYREVDFYTDGSHRCLSLHFENSVEDETQIIGVRFNSSDYGTCAPYTVKKPEHWVFEGISDIKKGTIFGKQSLNHFTPPKTGRYDPGRPGSVQGLTGQGASGWETDKLSKTAPADIIKVAKGKNLWGGADMIVREPREKRGGLFSVSSITFGGALLIDEVCSKIALNVIERFNSK